MCIDQQTYLLCIFCILYIFLTGNLISILHLSWTFGSNIKNRAEMIPFIVHQQNLHLHVHFTLIVINVLNFKVKCYNFLAKFLELTIFFWRSIVHLFDLSQFNRCSPVRDKFIFFSLSGCFLIDPEWQTTRVFLGWWEKGMFVSKCQVPTLTLRRSLIPLAPLCQALSHSYSHMDPQNAMHRHAHTCTEAYTSDTHLRIHTFLTYLNKQPTRSKKWHTHLSLNYS